MTSVKFFVYDNYYVDVRELLTKVEYLVFKFYCSNDICIVYGR